MGQLSDIKGAIKKNLDDLVTATNLGLVIEDDFKKPLFDRDIAKYPCAVLTVPEVLSDYLTDHDNARIYRFQIIVIMKAENITSITAVEDLIEVLLNKFDNDPNLQGKANGGTHPVTTQPASTLTKDGTLIYFSVIIDAKQSVLLTGF